MFCAYLLLLVMSVCVFLGLRHCSSRGVIVPPRQQGASTGDTIDVAMLYAPLNYYIYRDTLGGFCYDLWREMARSEDLKVNYLPVTSVADALRLLHSGKADVVASLPVSSGASPHTLFTDSVYTDRLVIVYSSPSGRELLTTPFQIAGKRVHTDGSAAGSLRLHNLRDEIGDTIYEQTHPELSHELIAMKVAKGEFELGIVNSRVADEMARQLPQLKWMAVGFDQLQAWVVADSSTQNRVNGMLRRSAGNPACRELRRRYGL